MVDSTYPEPGESELRSVEAAWMARPAAVAKRTKYNNSYYRRNAARLRVKRRMRYLRQKNQYNKVSKTSGTHKVRYKSKRRASLRKSSNRSLPGAYRAAKMVYKARTGPSGASPR